MGVSGDNKPLISEPLYIPVNIRKTVKSSYIIQYIFSFITYRKKLEVVNNNKHFQNLFKINIEDYKKLSGKYVIFDKKGIGKEYKIGTNILTFEGTYLNGKRNGKGKEYYSWHRFPCVILTTMTRIWLSSSAGNFSPQPLNLKSRRMAFSFKHDIIPVKAKSLNPFFVFN